MYLTKKQRRIMQPKDVECAGLGLGLGFGGGGSTTPPSVSAIYPSYGSQSGGTVVWIQVSDSSRVTGAKIAGVAVASLTAVSPTMVRGTTGAHAVGLGDVVLQSAAGDSAPLANGYQYFDPTDGNYSPSAAYVAPNYDDTPNHEAWYASAGVDVSTGGATPYPAASGGSPLFDGSTSQALVAAGPASTWYGVNDRHVVAVVDLVGISNNDTGNTYGNNAIVVDSNAVVGLTIYRTGAGPYTYHAEIFEYDVGSAFRKATLDITSLCDASGASLATLIIEAKKSGGNLQIRANGGSWTVGDACGALNAGTRTGTIQVGRGYAGGKINGTIRALVITGSAQSAGYSTAVAEWGNRIPGGWVRRLAYVLPTSPDEFHTRNAGHPILLGSGRRLIIGGFNTEGLAGWGGAYVTNEVWASDDDGASYYLLLAHDPNPPTSGVGARFPPMHSVASGSCQGRAVVCGGDPTFSPSTTRPADVWVSDTTGTVWTRVNSSAPWGTNYEANLGVIAGDIYYMGGQTDTLNAATANSHVYKSSDLGATWTQLADAPWTGHGCLWQLPTIDGEIYVVGGATYDNTTPVVYDGVYAFNGSTWRTVLAEGHGQWTGLLFSTVVALHGRLMMFSGSVGVTNQYRLLTSDDKGATWTTQKVGPGGTPTGADIVITTSSRVLRIPGLSTGNAIGKNVYSFGLEAT